MKYGSVCSGIEAASVAWEPLGWAPQWFSEIEAFPSAVLGCRWPDVPNLGDMTKHQEWSHAGSIDLLVGGTPCQSFSVAGLRKGLDDPRGNLALTYLAIADQFRPRWVVWENVPGVLSANGGRDFGSFLGALGKLGYGWSYRVLDAQFYGVAQRRRRVFVVGCAGDWRAAAAVLFEPESLSGNPPPSREAGEGAAPLLEVGARTGRSTDDPRAGSGIGSGGDPMFTLQAGKQHGVISMAHGQGGAEIRYGQGPCLTCNHEAPIVCHGTQDPITGRIAHALGRNSGQENAVCVTGPVAHTLRGEGFDASEDGTGRGTPTVATREVAQSLTGNYGKQPDNSDTAKGPNLAISGMAVRRLTPVECERLQGFPDNHTLIPTARRNWKGEQEDMRAYFARQADWWLDDSGTFDAERFEREWPYLASDGPRYKAIGNSMAVPVMHWIGKRIQAVTEIITERGAA